MLRKITDILNVLNQNSINSALMVLIIIHNTPYTNSKISPICQKSHIQKGTKTPSACVAAHLRRKYGIRVASIYIE